MTLFIEKPSLVRPMNTLLEIFGNATMRPVWRMTHFFVGAVPHDAGGPSEVPFSAFRNSPLSRKRKSRSFVPFVKSSCWLLASSWLYAA